MARPLTCIYDGCATAALPYACGPRCHQHAPWRESGRSWHTTSETGEPYRVDENPRWWFRPDGTVVPQPPLGANWAHGSRAQARGHQGGSRVDPERLLRPKRSGYGRRASSTEAAPVEATETVAKPKEEFPTESPIEAVLSYADRGWRTFPLWWVREGVCACPRSASCTSPGKHPLFPPAHPEGDSRRGACKGECGTLGHGLYDSTVDPDVLAGWWGRYPRANVGLPAGLNSLAVIDVDPRHGGEESFARLVAYLQGRNTPLPPTLTAITGSGGRHYVFAAPEGGVKSGANVFGSDMPGLDTRGRGGYIVAAPAGHACGGAYSWVDFEPKVAPWPAILSSLIDPPKAAAPVISVPTGKIDRYAAAALEKECDAVAGTVEPGRNVRLNEAAFKLGTLVGAGVLPEMTVRLALLAAAQQSGLTENEATRTILSGLRAGKAQPRQVAA